MWRKACYTEERYILDAKEYSKKRYGKSHKQTGFEEGLQVLVSTLNFNKLKCPNIMRDSLFRTLKYHWADRENALEVCLKDEFSRKHPLLPI
ncbi:hypothetical protein O181_014657 [Austropuccinia psidii MF-1]|uniref:Uncharacterized protein n=1 Tax=Austropuccinia psidii MF-1 TaxID=1389203 RepID=A0A9Q3GQ16_9BASI|nr:hypothetical protein [Austropuccinia psidii MF-1]